MKHIVKELDSELEDILATKTVGKAQTMMQSKSGMWFLAFASFVESATPFPILTDPFLIAALLLNRKRSILVVAVTTISSVVGGIAAYFTAFFFFEFLSSFMSVEMHTTFNELLQLLNEMGTFVLALIGAFTPIPYTTTAYVIGAMHGHIGAFILASLIGRSIRYGAVGILIYYFGPTAIKYAKRSIAITSLVLLVLGSLYLWHKFA